MWAIVNTDDNSVTEVIQNPKAVTINGVQHPKQIFSQWSWSELNAIGIYTVEAGVEGDDRWESTSQPTYAFDSANNKVTTTYTVTEKTLSDLKASAKEQAKKTANDYIKRFSWLADRVTMDSSKTIPSAVLTYCSNIRTDCNDICTAIDNTTTVSEFKALYSDTVDSDGNVTQKNRINRWTTDSTVTDYIR